MKALVGFFSKGKALLGATRGTVKPREGSLTGLVTTVTTHAYFRRLEQGVVGAGAGLIAMLCPPLTRARAADGWKIVGQRQQRRMMM